MFFFHYVFVHAIAVLGSPAQGCDVSLYMGASGKDGVHKYVLRSESSYLPE